MKARPRSDSALIKTIHESYGPAAARYLQDMPLVVIDRPQQLVVIDHLAEHLAKSADRVPKIGSLVDALINIPLALWCFKDVPSGEFEGKEVTGDLYFVLNADADHWYFDLFADPGLLKSGVVMSNSWGTMCYFCSVRSVAHRRYADDTGYFATESDSLMRYVLDVGLRKTGEENFIKAKAKFIQAMEEGEDTGELEGDYAGQEIFFNPLFPLPQKNVDVLLSERGKKTVVAHLETLVFSLTCILLWLMECDSRAVSVRNVGKAAATKSIHKARPWLRPDLVSIEFLNRLPTERSASKEHQGGSHRSPVRHKRRAHYRTLRAEKFKNHPLYGVEKAVPVKPAWVGPTQSIVQQKEYRLLTEPAVKEESA